MNLKYEGICNNIIINKTIINKGILAFRLSNQFVDTFELSKENSLNRYCLLPQPTNCVHRLIIMIYETSSPHTEKEEYFITRNEMRLFNASGTTFRPELIKTRLNLFFHLK